MASASSFRSFFVQRVHLVNHDSIKSEMKKQAVI